MAKEELHGLNAIQLEPEIMDFTMLVAIVLQRK